MNGGIVGCRCSAMGKSVTDTTIVYSSGNTNRRERRFERKGVRVQPVEQSRSTKNPSIWVLGRMNVGI